LRHLNPFFLYWYRYVCNNICGLPLRKSPSQLQTDFINKKNIKIYENIK
jgi:hypothetical protein